MEHAETGVEASADGSRNETLDRRIKRRRDHVISDKVLLSHLTSTIGRRVIPEVAKAFAYRVNRFEGFKIVCYDGDSGGFFRPHRDNLSPSTSNRRFALSLNLNDEYQGGELRFPEYGPDFYRPPAGAAAIFSCSHLHEALEVTNGMRFAVLSFILGDVQSTTDLPPSFEPTVMRVIWFFG